MPSQTLTSRAINRKPPKEGTLEMWDTVMPGLHLRIGYGGRKTYSVTTRLYRVGEKPKQIRRSVGTTVTHTLAEARDAARDFIREAAKGNDIASK